MSDSAMLWTAAHQAPLFSTISWSLLKFISSELVMLSNHLILYCSLLLLPSLFPSIGSLPMSQLFASGGQSIGASASATVLPVSIKEWFPLGLTGWFDLFAVKGILKNFLQHQRNILQVHLLVSILTALTNLIFLKCKSGAHFGSTRYKSVHSLLSKTFQ